MQAAWFFDHFSLGYFYLAIFTLLICLILYMLCFKFIKRNYEPDLRENQSLRLSGAKVFSVPRCSSES
jgi:Na+/melibiose symporter-like transporter